MSCYVWYYRVHEFLQVHRGICCFFFIHMVSDLHKSLCYSMCPIKCAGIVLAKPKFYGTRLSDGCPCPDQCPPWWWCIASTSGMNELFSKSFFCVKLQVSTNIPIVICEMLWAYEWFMHAKSCNRYHIGGLLLHHMTYQINSRKGLFRGQKLWNVSRKIEAISWNYDTASKHNL